MKSSKRNKTEKQIEALKVNRKKKYVQMGFAVAFVVVMVVVKSILEMIGVLDSGNSALGSGMILVAFLLAAIGGIASMDISKINKEIRVLSQKCERREYSK